MQYALCIMGTVNERGYDGQHKCTICAACRACHSSKLTEVSFSPNSTDLMHLQLAQMPRSSDFCVHNDNNNDTTDYFTPVHACGVIITSHCLFVLQFWFSWRYQLPEFNKDYHVVAIDMRGYGETDRPPNKNDYTIDLLTQDIVELIPALGHSKCNLVAHDWGGVVAW